MLVSEFLLLAVVITLSIQMLMLLRRLELVSPVSVAGLTLLSAEVDVDRVVKMVFWLLVPVVELVCWLVCHEVGSVPVSALVVVGSVRITLFAISAQLTVATVYSIVRAAEQFDLVCSFGVV